MGEITNLYKPSGNRKSNSKESDPTCMENARCYFCEFCDNTSIHGFKFLGERGRYIIEKIWWLLAVSAAISGSGYLISKAYQKWDTSPVVINFSNTETSIWQIPFPAVTICPETKMNKEVFNYTKVYHKLQINSEISQEERDYFNVFQMVCNELLIGEDDTKAKFLNKEDINKFINASFEIEKSECKWMGVPQDCDEITKSIVTTEGNCLTFNMLPYEDIYSFASEKLYDTLKNIKIQKWSLEDGYSPNAPLHTFPRRTILPGIKGGFQIDLQVENDDLDYICGELQGYKVTLHHPGEEPDMDKHIRLPLNQVVAVAIKPSMIKTSEEIRGYRPEKRQCYLPGEKQLALYKIYSQQSCMFECLFNYTLSICGCSAVFDDSLNMKICGPGSRKCVNDAKVKFLQKDVSSEANEIKNECNCLPGCTTLEFDMETSQINWEWRKTLEVFDQQFDFVKYINHHQSRLIVYYKEMQFMTSERHQLYGIVDFLANCGGLLGLFCGFSFISSLEILYYLTLRFVCNLKKFGGKIWSGAPELLANEDEAEK